MKRNAPWILMASELAVEGVHANQSFFDRMQTERIGVQYE